MLSKIFISTFLIVIIGIVACTNKNEIDIVNSMNFTKSEVIAQKLSENPLYIIDLDAVTPLDYLLKPLQFEIDDVIKPTSLTYCIDFFL